MKRTTPVVLGLLVLLVVSGGVVFAQEDSATIGLHEQNNSGQSGTAKITISEDGSTATVEINISGGSDEPQPAHIHAGTCANLDPKPLYPLNNVVNGHSITTLTEESAIGMPSMETSDFAINVHKSVAEAAVYVACGEISEANVVTVGMPRTGSASDLVTVGAFAALLVLAGGLLSTVSRRRV
jgi:VCBS repeat-containing protein